MIINDKIITDAQYAEDQSIYTLEFGPNVREIGRGAFYNCKNLTEVTIPSTVVVVHEGAFAGCSNLIKIIYGNNIVFEPYAFSACFNLRTLESGSAVARTFSMDDLGTYIVTIKNDELSKDEYEIYTGRYTRALDGFPSAPVNTSLPLLYVAVVTKNGKEYIWYHTDVNIAIIGARFLASGKTFEQYFDIKLDPETKLTCEQFLLLIGGCSAGRSAWNYFCKYLMIDPNGSYPIKFFLQLCDGHVPSVASRIRGMLEHKKEVFSYLDIKHPLPYNIITKEIVAWRDAYVAQGRKH